MHCDSDFVDLILLLLLLRHELLDSVTGVLQIKNLRLLVFFSPRCYFFSSWTVEAAPASSSCFFQKRRRKCFAEGKSLCSKKKKKKNQGAIPPPSLVTVWGIQSKVCPVTCSPRNKQPAESPKTKAIRGGRLVLRAKSRPPFFFLFFFFSESFHHGKNC